MTRLGIQPWVLMWLLAIAIFAACKWLTWRSANTALVPMHVQLAYLLAWPGLDAPAFFADRVPRNLPSPREWRFALAKTLVGAALFCGLARQFSNVVVQGWIGMVGLVFLLHFGFFHLLSCFWRSRGRNARPLMDWPSLASTVSDFWGRRWNTAFRDFTYRFVFQPLRKVMGPRAALVGGFAVSGLVHDVVISIPAGAGYGLPTLYFLMQGIALLAERSHTGQALGLGRGSVGRMFAILIVTGPAFILFHPPFVRAVMIPFMEASGAI